MANIQLPYDRVYWEDIRVANNQGVFEPVAAGDTFSVVSSDPTNLAVAIGTNPKTSNPGFSATPMHSAGPFLNISVTVSDTSGLTPFVAVFDAVPDVAPTQILGDPASVTTVAQPMPPA
jgi:hypothetical protein